MAKYSYSISCLCSKYVQIAVLGFLYTELAQVRGGRPFQYDSVRIISRAVAGTLEPEIALLHRTTQMRADQAESLQTIFVVEEDRRDMSQDRAAVERIVACRTDIEFAWRRGVIRIAQVTEQAADAQQACQGQK